MEFRADINGLRAVAVLSVLLYHFGIPGFGGGFVGVDIFYVISGYLMTGILHDRVLPGKISVWSFYLARARRIVPALLGLCAAVLLLGWFWVAPSHYQELATHAAASLGFLSNIVYWQQVNYFNPDAAGFWFLHTWSLSVEWQFYLLYPPALLLLARICGGTQHARYRLALTLVLLASLALAVLAALRAPQAGFYLLPPRAWELLAGGMVWLHQARAEVRTTPRPILAYAGALFTIAPLFLLNDQSPWATLLVAIPVLGSVLILLGRAANPLLDNKLFQALGRWSYSIYLWHWPIAVLLRESGWQSGWIGTTVGMAASVLLGYASFRLIETPARVQLGKLGSAGQWVSQLAATGGLAALALTVVAAHGFTQRGPHSNRDVYQRTESDRQQWGFPTGCSALGGNGQPRICSLGPTAATQRVLLLGDSHAQQWYPWFVTNAEKQSLHVDFATYEGCPVGYETRPGLNCAAFWSAVTQLPVTRSARQVLLLSNWQVPGVDGTVSNEDLQTLARARQRLQQRLPSLLQALGSSGAQVTLIGTLPRVARHVPDEITARLFRGSSIDGRRSVDCNHFRELAAGINEDLRQIAAAAGAGFVDPLELFCTGGAMPVVSADNRLLFRDGNHVSSVGAQRYGDALFNTLMKNSR
jgi:peptidoglycan/LPS O-acetylase OafA/YrhL